MIGVELVADRHTKQYLSLELFGEIWEQCREMGVLFGRGGANENVSSFLLIYLFFNI